MQKFGAVENFIVATWNKPDMEACLDYNLPCVDAGPFVLSRLNISADGFGSSTNGDGVKILGSVEYYIVTWVRPIIVLELLKRGYTVHASGKAHMINC